MAMAVAVAVVAVVAVVVVVVAVVVVDSCDGSCCCGRDRWYSPLLSSLWFVCSLGACWAG